LHALEGDLCRIRKQDKLAIEAFRSVQPHLFRDQTQVHFHHVFAEVLWRDGQQESALEQLQLAQKALRRARRTAGIDATALEYIAQRQWLFNDAVFAPLTLNRTHLAFKAVQDGKATLFVDLRTRLRRGQAGVPPEILQARQTLVESLRQQRPSLVGGGVFR